MDLAFMARIAPVFADAAILTAGIAAASTVLGLAAAGVVAALCLSSFRLLRAAGTAYVSVIRGTPALIQIFLIYFGGPQFGLNLEPLAAGIIGLGLNIAAYMAEVIRGAVVAVDRGQAEAARAIGFSRAQTFYRVVLPQAAPLMVRPLGVNIVALLKGTALVSTISVVELTFTAQRFIGSTYKPFEVFCVSGALYIVMVYAVVAAVNVIDRRVAVP